MTDDRPNTIPWPPLIYLGAAITGVFLHWIAPIPWPGAPVSYAIMMVGIGLAALALALELATALTFRAHKTTILPHRGATRLITTGPFSWSRNPIYLANTLLVISAGLILGNAWLLAAALIAAALTHVLAIKREETHLEVRFGAEWQAYRNRTARWFGRSN